MKTFSVIFYKNPGLINSMIRFFTHGQYSHMAVQFGSHVYEAIGGRLDLKAGFYRTDSPLELHSNNRLPLKVTFHEFHISETDYFETKQLLDSLVGTKYSYIEVIGYILPFMPSSSRLYCSEILRFLPLFKTLPINNKMSPDQAFLVSSAMQYGISLSTHKPPTQ